MKKQFLSFALIAFLFSSCVDYDTNSGFDDVTTPNTENNEVRVWATSHSKIYLLKELPVEYSERITEAVIRINPNVTYQTIDGFGGGLTGSSAYLLMQMSPDARTKVLKELFDTKEGAGLEHLRLSIGASDFSMELYTYCDKPGIENFAIPEIDKRDLIPVIKEILAINPNVKFIASPWSPPAWMKDSNHLNKGKLKGPEVYADYANYFVKYVKAMKAEGITIDAITLQNEAQFESNTHPSMVMDWQEQATIIGQYLGPKFESEKIATKIYALDHNFDIYEYAINVLKDAKANKYTAGTAFHGYVGTPSAIDFMTKQFPDKQIYMTELSGGEWNEKDQMKTMFYYLNDMAIPTIQKGSSNFMMFNIALNSQHGPVTPGGTFCKDCRGVVTIDGDSYKKEVEYYLLGHFGKVVRSGAKRIEAEKIGVFPSETSATAFVNPDGSRALILSNNGGSALELTLKDQESGKRLVYSLAPSSVSSFLFK